MRIIRVSDHDAQGNPVEERNAQAGGHYVHIEEVLYDGEPGQAAGAIWDELPEVGGHWIIHNDELIATR